MNKWTYPHDPLTWGNLAKLIDQMTPEQKEREVLGFGHAYGQREVFVPLRKLLITNDLDSAVCESNQPVLLF